MADSYHIMYFSCLPFYILSIIGSLFIIFNFWKFAPLRSFSFKLVFMIALSDLIRSIANVIPILMVEGEWRTYLCWTQAILGNMAGLSTTLWNCSVAHSIKYVFTNPNLYKKNKLYPNKLFKKYLFINTSLTILLSIPPIFPLDENHAYALAGSWCWIRGNTEYDNIVRIVSQYAVQILCGVYIIFVYWYFLRKLFMRTANISEQRGRLMNETIGRLKWFPIVYFICYIPQIINRIYQIAFNDENYVLTVVHFGALAVSGLLDALIYSWTKPVKALYKKIWSSWTHDREHHNSLNIIWALYSELDDDDDDDSHIQETKTLKKTTGTKTAISGITTAPSTMPSTSKLSINNCT